MIGVQRHRRGALLPALVMASVVLAGCVNETEGTASPVTPEVPTPTLPRFAIDPEPLWGNSQVPVTDIADIQFRAGRAILAGYDADSSFVAAVDAATGTTQWSIDLYDDLNGGEGAVLAERPRFLVGDSVEGPVLVEYFSDTCRNPLRSCPPGSVQSSAERGIAALSPVDGSVLWKYAVVPAFYVESEQADTARDTNVKLVATRDDVTVLVAGPSDALDARQNADPAEIRTIAVNAMTGELIWEAAGYWAQFIADETVLARVPGSGPRTADYEPGTAVALDLSSGNERWSATDRLSQSEFLLATDDLALVRAVEDGVFSWQIVDVADGTTVADLEEWVERCATDGERLIACSIGVLSGLLSYELGETEARSFPDQSALFLGLGFNGYLFAKALSSGEHLAVDRWGNVLSDPLPGRAVRVTDEYAVFANDADPDSFAVHRVTT